MLGFMAAGMAALCPLCANLARANGTPAAGEHAAGPAHWAYEGATGPEHWGELSADFKVCNLGLEQTPVDLKGAVRAVVGRLDISFQPMKLRVVNNGHTIQVNCDAGSASEIGGTRFELVQFHFHHPSEHLLAGKAFDLECHFVHRSAAGDLAVIGVFIRPGASNSGLEPVWAAMPREQGPERATGMVFDPSDLLPKERGYFRYAGSLTTPPCSEGITWTIFKEPVEASPEQIRQFASLFPVNARSVQSIHRRFLLDVE